MPDFSFLTTLKLLPWTAAGLAGLSILVLIHEAGHFAAAKLMGVRVKMFSLGFGRTIFSITRGDTTYCLKAIPFGGFVAMAGEQPDDDREGRSDEFSTKPVPARMFIALAGPFVNVVFAFGILTLLFMTGVQEPITNEIPVGMVIEGSPAEAAGIKEGDFITRLSGKPVNGLENFLQDIAVEAGNPLAITVRRDSTVHEFQIIPVMHELGFAWAGLVPGQTAVLAGELSKDKPAEKSGFKPGDRMVDVSGVIVPDVTTFIEIINASNGRELLITIERKGKTLTIPVTPEPDPSDGKYRIGMQIHMKYDIATHIVKRSFTESLEHSVTVNVGYTVTMFRFLKSLVTRQVKLKAMSGPLGILMVIGSSFRRNVQEAIKILALISLNLGIVNLLPLVITDGGIILFLMLEAVRRKPLPLRAQMVINQVAISLFIALALFITFHDILKIPLFQ